MIGNAPVPDEQAAAHAMRSLELPRMDIASLLRHFGPGMILMMTSIGTSHLVTAPTAGGRFEYALLWCVPFAYLLKYYGFEMAFRFTQATGKGLTEAYSTAWMKWPLWYVLITTILQCAIGQAGRLIAAAAVLYYLFTELAGVEIPIVVYGIVLGLASVAVILRGSYRTLEVVTKCFAGILVFSTLVVYSLKPAPLSAFTHFLTPEAPDGSWLIIAAFLGLLPTGMDVSLQASEWGKAKKVGIGRIRRDAEAAGMAVAFDPFSSSKQDLAIRISGLTAEAREYCTRWFRISLWDYRLGHLVSFALACTYLMLAAMWVFPSSVEGTAVMGEISGMFSQTSSETMAIVFLIGAFAATYSTAFNYFDGWPRIVGACCRNMFRCTAALEGIARADLTPEKRSKWYSEYNIYRITMIFSLVGASAIIGGLPRPVFLVLVASALALFISPVIYILNIYYCLTVIPKDQPGFYPSRAAVWFSVASCAVFVGTSLLLIVTRLFGIQPIG